MWLSTKISPILLKHKINLLPLQRKKEMLLLVSQITILIKNSMGMSEDVLCEEGYFLDREMEFLHQFCCN
jgi:hypothetical protein